MNTQTSLSDKIAVITGASSGIGASTARLLASQGMTVIIIARNTQKLNALAKEIGPNAIPMTADVSKLIETKQVFDEINEKFGAIDLLLNNAGVGIYGQFMDSFPDDWVTQININLTGVLNCTYAAIPLMKGRKGAMISTISSVGGRYGYAGWAVYSATKYAVIGFQDSLRKELSHLGIRVTVLEPGAVWTDWGDNIDKQIQAERRTDVQALQPEDVAQAVLYSYQQPENVVISEIMIRPIRQTEN